MNFHQFQLLLHIKLTFYQEIKMGWLKKKKLKWKNKNKKESIFFKKRTWESLVESLKLISESHSFLCRFFCWWEVRQRVEIFSAMLLHIYELERLFLSFWDKGNFVTLFMFINNHIMKQKRSSMSYFYTNDHSKCVIII